ncbi:hypothetical protein NC651_022163 [Populus alba x Populus x berolinensis]|nr:hypothetical protein NC651_022163 [Populus alba x Populus x berolinensis]
MELRSDLNGVRAERQGAVGCHQFKDETLRILESVLVFKDLKSLIETRSDVKQSMRSESFSIIHQIKIKLSNRSFSLSNYVLALSLSQIIEEIKRFKDRDVKSAASGSGYFNRCCKEESLLGLSNLVFEIHKLQRNEIKLVEIVDAMEW